jgi:PAS domain S-box-containing protein
MAVGPRDTNPERPSSAEPVGWSGLKALVEEGERTSLLRFLEGQSRILEMIARSDPLAAVLEELTKVLEQQVDGMACSVLLLSADRKHLRHVAAPSLPERYTRAIDGTVIGPRAGSCGTAAFLGRPVIVTDIANDPLWVDDKDLALSCGLKACWSTPILSRRDEVLGTFGMYHRQPFAPSSVHFGLTDLAMNLARIAIERDAADRDRERLWDAKRFADRYRMLLQATGEVVWEWDLENGSVRCNGGGLSAFGYGAGEVGRKVNWWTERIHPEEVDRVRKGVDLAIDSGKPLWEEEYRFRRKNETYADLAVRGLIVRDDAGKAVRIVGSLRDTTRRKRHEREAEQAAERFQSATEAAVVGTWRLDVKTQFLLADASLNRLAGQKEEETVHRFSDTLRAIHPEDRARVAQAVEESIATGRPYEIDHRVVLDDGQIRWLRSRGRMVFDKHGCGEALTGAAADITDLKRAEQSMAILADASKRLSESLDFEQTLSSMAGMAVPSFADAVLVHMKDPRTGEPRLAVAHAANPELLATLREMLRTGSFRVAARGRRVMQTGLAELLPRMTPEWLDQEDLEENVASPVRRFRVTSVIHVPIALAREPIGVIVFAATGTRIYDEKDLAFAEELARRASNAMHNAQLFQVAEAERVRAEEAAALRERLVAIVGHDLRNPLSAIIAAAQLLHCSDLATHEANLVARIQKSGNRMMRMIGQVLDFARVRAGQSFELDFAPIDLHQICNTVVSELRMSRPGKEIDLDFEGRTDLVGDPDRIAQVLSNLIGNAIQHGTPGPISVSIRDAKTDVVAIAVHNFGPPIPEEAQATLFDAFRQEPCKGDGDSRSIGLGLFIANEIVRAHGGTIVVRSPDRDGTTFVVTLPRKPVVPGAFASPQ